MSKNKKVAYQGIPGAYSYMACRNYFGSDVQPVGFATFAEVIQAVTTGECNAGLLPVENSTAGRVASVHELLSENSLYITGEYFLNIKHQLIIHESASFTDVKRVYSHPQALAQCSNYIKEQKFTEVPYSDTAAAAMFISQGADIAGAAIASESTVDLYKDIKIAQKDINNESDNTTRFLCISTKQNDIDDNCQNCITSLFYTTKNIPAALFKSLAGFATEGINIIKIESFVPMFKHNTEAKFYIEFLGSGKSVSAKRAIDELGYYAEKVSVLGTYQAGMRRDA